MIDLVWLIPLFPVARIPDQRAYRKALPREGHRLDRVLVGGCLLCGGSVDLC